MGTISSFSRQAPFTDDNPSKEYDDLYLKLNDICERLYWQAGVQNPLDVDKNIREALQEEPVKTMLHSFLEEAKHDFGYEPPAHEKQTLGL